LTLRVSGNSKLVGQVELSSSKNAILPILAAALLSSGPVKINKVPKIKDVTIMIKLLKELGLSIKHRQDSLIINGEPEFTDACYDLVRKIRASFLIAGPLLGRKGKVMISYPGGCAIGNRPIDLHLKGFQALGADINISSGNVIARADYLSANHIYLDFPSVGATENIIMAATMARGVTYIENAALEPEIVDLANFINSMGGRIKGAGSNLIKIEGVTQLGGTEYTPIPDRIEAGTYMVAAAATGGEVVIKNTIPEHVKAISAKLKESGATVVETEDYIQVSRNGPIKPVYIKTLPYPGFPTDMQAQFMAYLGSAQGSSVLTESVFENRFMHVPELVRMGMSIKTEGRTAIIKGVSKFTAATVRATDLRAGAALIIAALTADGDTIITNSEHIDRGYENIVDKLNALGARIYRI
jgi:UDP-N-acetylglucosamine 1-carboxyvinyltransferase